MMHNLNYQIYWQQIYLIWQSGFNLLNTTRHDADCMQINAMRLKQNQNVVYVKKHLFTHIRNSVSSPSLISFLRIFGYILERLGSTSRTFSSTAPIIGAAPASINTGMHDHRIVVGHADNEPNLWIGKMVHVVSHIHNTTICKFCCVVCITIE